jgi:hypothetical protein
MARLFKKHPLSVFEIVKSDQGTLIEQQSPCDGLKRMAFYDDPGFLRESIFGAVVLEDYRSTDFNPTNCEFGEHIVWSIRIDTRKVPPAALKLAFDAQMARELVKAKELGKNFISRDRKREIKEQCKLRLLAKVPPAPKVVDCWWNTLTGLAYMTDKSSAAVKAFVAVFDQAFGPHYSAAEFIVSGSDTTSIDIGSAMLNGLWSSRQSGKAFGIGPCMAWLDNEITISSGTSEVRGVSGDSGVDDMEEIAVGIDSGKRVTKAAIIIAKNDGEEWARVKADTHIFPLLNLSIPTVTHHDEEEFAGALMEQIGNIEEACNLVAQLARQFQEAA